MNYNCISFFIINTLTTAASAGFDIVVIIGLKFYIYLLKVGKLDIRCVRWYDLITSTYHLPPCLHVGISKRWSSCEVVVHGSRSGCLKETTLSCTLCVDAPCTLHSLSFINRLISQVLS